MSIHLTESQNLQIGILAAFIEGVVLQPTLYWKNARAHKLPFTLNPRVIYRGTTAALYNEMQMMGLQFVLTRIFQRFNNQGDGTMTRMQEYRSAFFGGAVAAIFASPVELVMIQQQLHGGSMYATVKRVAIEHGPLKLLRGVLPAMARDSLYVSGMLGLTPIIQRHLMDDFDISGPVAGMWASLIGGVLGAVPSHPFDIVKTCMQGDMKQLKYYNVRTTFKALYQQGGIIRFFDGCFWRGLNVVATVYIANECRIHFPRLIFGIDQ